jgi:UDP-N-acetylmuramoylalanine--D-glutamate ligase
MKAIHTLQNIGILGSGITAKAVTEKVIALGLTIVPPEDADIVVASPGIPPKTFPTVACEIVSEIEFAYRYLIATDTPPTLIGITGTNGKSTVTAMVAHILDCPMAGNIGIPLITYVPENPNAIPPKHLAIELSSYQLETCSTFKPQIAILLGLTPDHIDRHPTMESYAAAKQHLIAAQTADDLVIYDAENPWSKSIAESSQARKKPVSKTDPLYQKIVALTQRQNCLGLIGTHNHMNALCAGLAAAACGLSDEQILDKLSSFQALPHRIEWVGTLNGCRVFNDSKATNPESTAVALTAFDKPIHLILGGKDKGLVLDTFAKEVIEKVASISVFGEIADRMVDVFRALGEALPPLAQTETLAEALDTARRFSSPNDVILFSPACSSFDQFQSFEHRGDVFRTMVQTLEGRTDA